jgi:hypothetical protein
MLMRTVCKWTIFVIVRPKFLQRLRTDPVILYLSRSLDFESAFLSDVVTKLKIALGPPAAFACTISRHCPVLQLDERCTACPDLTAPKHFRLRPIVGPH